MSNWFNWLQEPLVTRGMLKQAAYWGVTIWLIAILTGLLHRLLAVSG